MGALKWGLRPLSVFCAQSSTIVQICGLLGPLFKENFRRTVTAIVGNRGQLWTSTLSPHLQSPHSDFSEACFGGILEGHDTNFTESAGGLSV